MLRTSFLVWLRTLACLLLMSDSTWAELSWPIRCIPGQECYGTIGYPALGSRGLAFDCSVPRLPRHQGTDILVSWAHMDSGIDVLAAADGVVLWSFDGKYDRCPQANEPDCQTPRGPSVPGRSSGYQVCTPQGPYCRNGAGQCFWCFDGGNVVVIRHDAGSGVFATRYDHLKKHSIRVKLGDRVRRGQPIAKVGSSGHSSEPHLHFEVWGKTYYDPVDPWQGKCNPTPVSPWSKHPAPWKNR